MSESNPRANLQSGAVDTHCHLFLLNREPQHVVEESRAAGVETLVCVGIDPETSRRSLELAESFRGVFATAGMHPHEARDLDERAGATIEELAQDPQVVGIGETGLDFFRMRSPREDQQRALRLHAALSRESGKPLVIHVRDAWAAVFQVLDEERVERVVFHCFSGDVGIARECVARGWFISFAANVTYPKNDHLRAAAATVPLELLLTETDSPFLSPQRRRGRDNAPMYTIDVIEELTRVRDESFETVRDATRANAMRAFPGLR